MTYNFRRPDYCSAAGAQYLADELRTYWRQRGYDVSLRVETYGGRPAIFGTTMTTYTIRSDMVGGWPVRRADDNQRS